MDLQNLLNIPSKSIYCFINEADKIVHISFSRNTLLSIYRNIQMIKQGHGLLSQHSDKLSFRIIETIVNDLDLRIRYQYWVRYYQAQGYQLYRSYNAVGYKVILGVMSDALTSKQGLYHFCVKLVSRGYRELIVGVFNFESDAKLFIETHYTSIDRIVYADNDLTRRFRDKLR